DPSALARIVQTMMGSQLEPIAFDMSTNGEPRTSNASILRCLASPPAVVAAQVPEATAALEAFALSIDVVDGDAERARWQEHATGIWEQPGAIPRASWLPANL